MNRTDRLYAIAEELRSAGGRGRTSTQLAQRFEVSARTVKRDVAALQQAGLPIWAQAGPSGGYVLDAVANLPPLNLTAAEASAIALALTLAADLPFAADGRSALRKVLTAMPKAERAQAAELGSRLWLRLPAPTPRPAVMRSIEEALRRRVVLVLQYSDRSGRESRRSVEPLAFAHTNGSWYLLAWCRRSRGGRWFRLDRARDAVLTTQPVPDRDLRSVFGEPPADARPLDLAVNDVPAPAPSRGLPTARARPESGIARPSAPAPR